jgi:hypothetical protein
VNAINLVCLILATFGAFLVYQGKKRVFNRTSWLGVEQFSSYGQKVLSRLTDGSLLVVGYCCLGAAPVILVVEYASEYLMLGFVLAIAFWIDNEWCGRRNK